MERLKEALKVTAGVVIFVPAILVYGVIQMIALVTGQLRPRSMTDKLPLPRD